ncbi:MAG: hypothetical protein FWH48_10115, partial [Oscillospiraceae bacterium]|nr:hypothetical protein [Oscillospiraceae bacterium]
MAKRPESYGLKLINIESDDRHAIRAAKNTLYRLFGTLHRLCQCGVLENHSLAVSAGRFKEACKTGQNAVSNPIPKYELILSRLTDFGFVVSDFSGKPFAKTVTSFTVERPDDPEMIDTIKTYCDCRDKIEIEAAKGLGNNFHHNFYRCDYKITADWKSLPNQQWIRDEIRSKGYDERIADFYVAFYEYSQNYPEIAYNGEYNYKKKRIARGLFEGLGRQNLSLILKDMDAYIELIKGMPETIQSKFKVSSCNHCGFQGATNEHCKFRRNWTLDGPHDACAFYGFQFDDLDLARVPDYWRLLEAEYGLKRAMEVLGKK